MSGWTNKIALRAPLVPPSSLALADVPMKCQLSSANRTKQGRRLTWGELRHHLVAIHHKSLPQMQIPCTKEPNLICRLLGSCLCYLRKPGNPQRAGLFLIFPSNLKYLTPGFIATPWSHRQAGSSLRAPTAGTEKEPFELPCFPYSLVGRVLDKKNNALGILVFFPRMFSSKIEVNNYRACPSGSLTEHFLHWLRTVFTRLMYHKLSLPQAQPLVLGSLTTNWPWSPFVNSSDLEWL